MTGPYDNDDRDGDGPRGPTESDLERYGDEEYELRDRSGNPLTGHIWKLAAGIAFIAFALSMLFNILLPAFARGRGPEEPELVSATVTSVLDAHMVEVDIDGARHTVRYIGIAAPGVGEPYHDVAIAANEEWTLNKTVTLEADESDADPDGALPRYVWVDGSMVNLSLVAVGLAAVSDDGRNGRYRDAFISAESNARAAGLGIWAEGAGESASRARGAAPRT